MRTSRESSVLFLVATINYYSFKSVSDLTKCLETAAENEKNVNVKNKQQSSKVSCEEVMIVPLVSI